MSDTSRIDDLRRRVLKDPASIAFAQLAEEYRRAGRLAESVETCRAGLLIHPGYLSARVTLGRALLETGALDDARREFEVVLGQAPEHLAATRALADLHQRLGNTDLAHEYLDAAQQLAPNDPELDRMRSRLPPRTTPLRPVARIEDARTRRVLTHLERWLEAIHATRAERRT